MNPCKARKQHAAEFKAQAIELLAIGRPVSELAEELCVSANPLYYWKSSSKGALLRQENEMLKKCRSNPRHQNPA